MNIKTTKTTTALLSLALVASFAGTMISIPQMIGSANGQSKACPDGTRPVQGQCVTTTSAPATETCPSTVTGPSFTVPVTGPRGGKCTATLIAQSLSNFRFFCEQDLGGTFNNGAHTCTFQATLSCPNGGELIGDQCVTTTTTKPGQGPRS